MHSAGQFEEHVGDAEAARLRALRAYEVLDTPADAAFDDMARLAARLCAAPIAVVTLIDHDRQWFKSAIGLDFRETPRHVAFCAHTVQGDGSFVVEDARLDPRFADNPMVTGPPGVRFYAGVPLRVDGGHALGALAVFDHQPRQLSPRQHGDLQTLARQVVALMEERHQRRRAEAASEQVQRQSDSMLAIAGRVAQLGAWRLDLDTQRVLWSDGVAAIHGMPPGHQPGLDEAIAYYVEPHRSRLVLAVQACTEAGEPFDLELVLQPAGGLDLRWVRSIGEAVRDASGRITQLRGACQDITERRSQQLQIQRLADRLTATLESIPDAFFAVDGQWRMQLVNHAFEQLLARPRAEMIGRVVFDLLPAGQNSHFIERCRQAMATRQPVEFSGPDSQGRHFEVRVFPADDGISVYARDDTARQQAMAQLRQAQKMESIGTLAGGIAHDFNNILGAILGNVALAQDGLAADSAARPPLTAIGAAAVRARSLVQQILAFGRQQPTQRAPQPLLRLVKQTVDLLRSTLPATVAVTLRPPPAELVAEVDGNQLQQVLINLCTNAWHAMPAGGGQIVIGLDRTPWLPPGAASGPAQPVAHLWVQDDGCGIDAATQARIFEPFFTTKPVGQGTGLGLSVAHGIVVAHGGTIAVDSTPGCGATFHIQLPLAAQHATGAAPAAAPAAARLDGLRVLCVDDDAVMLLTMQALLERAGCSVSAHAEPQPALDALRQAPGDFDLVVTDYNMPGTDGLALARSLQQLVPALPIVMASGFLSDTLCAQAHALGVRALVQKERTVEDLVDAVRRALANGAG